MEQSFHFTEMSELMNQGGNKWMNEISIIVLDRTMRATGSFLAPSFLRPQGSSSTYFHSVRLSSVRRPGCSLILLFFLSLSSFCLEFICIGLSVSVFLPKLCTLYFIFFKRTKFINKLQIFHIYLWWLTWIQAYLLENSLCIKKCSKSLFLAPKLQLFLLSQRITFNVIEFFTYG